MLRIINRKSRRWGIGTALGLMVVLIWWFRVFSPLEARMSEISANIEKKSMELNHLKKEVNKISTAIQTYKRQKSNFSSLSNIFFERKTVEETNAAVQADIQKFLEDHDISLTAYKELPPGKWQDYSVGRLEFQFSTSIEGLSEVLRHLETLKGATRIERVVISQRSRSSEGLRVVLRIGTLFVRELNRN
jgi:hypothetical protein